MQTHDYICLLCRDEPTRAAVDTAVTGLEISPCLVPCARISELAGVLTEHPVVAAVIDIDPYPMEALTELEPIIARFPGTRFVLVADHVDQDLLRAAMDVGARHVIERASLGADLVEVMQRVIGHSHAVGSQRGSVVTVLSAGGGCGATTLAVNLAAELPRGERDPALLIDLDHAYGAIASYLDLHGEYGIAEILSHPHRIDAPLVSSTALKHDERLHALINPVSISFVDPAPLDFGRLEHTLLACRQAYRWTVVDAPRLPIDITARLAHASRFTLIVAQLSVKDIRAARAMQQALLRYDVADESIRFVINRYRSRRAALSLEEARKALGDHEPYLVRNDFASTIEGINLGQPLGRCAPRSGPRRDIRSLAETVVEISGNGHVYLNGHAPLEQATP